MDGCICTLAGLAALDQDPFPGRAPWLCNSPRPVKNAVVVRNASAPTALHCTHTHPSANVPYVNAPGVLGDEHREHGTVNKYQELRMASTMMGGRE